MIPNLGRCGVPAFGIGTYQLQGDECVRAVKLGLQTGFRLLDTTVSYRNGAAVCEGIRQSGVSRNELFVIVKVSPKSYATAQAVTSSVHESIGKLGIEYADLVLLHWPGASRLRLDDAAGHHAARQRAYEALRVLQQAGTVRHLGVSNFLPRHFAATDVVCGAAFLNDDVEAYPAVNQIELHPLCIQADAVGFCRQHGIVLQQYSPLGQGKAELLEHTKLREVVAKEFPTMTVCDVLLMWGLSQGYSTIVRSASAEHTAANWRAGTTFFAPADSPHGLTKRQHEVLRDLRARMGVEGDADTHFCWDSSAVA